MDSLPRLGEKIGHRQIFPAWSLWVYYIINFYIYST